MITKCVGNDSLYSNSTDRPVHGPPKLTRSRLLKGFHCSKVAVRSLLSFPHFRGNQAPGYY